MVETKFKEDYELSNYFKKTKKKLIFGFSIFLGNNISANEENWIEQMTKIGFKKVFTSVHIPEENTDLVKNNLIILASLCKKKNLELHIDTSKDTLYKMGYGLNNIEDLLEIGVTGVRMDYGIDNEYIAKLSKLMTVSINASTILEEDFLELEKYGSNFKNIIAWHNYYPKPYSALEDKWFALKNKWIRENYNIPIYAFIQGDSNQRGPLKKGLPTIESQRNKKPFISALELKNRYFIDGVFIGDPGLTEISMKLFKEFIENETITVPVKWHVNKEYKDNINSVFHNRRDFSGNIIRAEESRLKNWFAIKPSNTSIRKIGDITVDNDLANRYAGEINIIKKELPADDSINIIGKVEKDYLDLLPYIGAGEKFKMEEINEK
ncbi:MAG: MupG family TIM beta-alpha barrel fold protein [Miniphocaeibacter sp.]|uniref:MupG family TIM beta-alpha barrel fold protein n=1 Tax=Miniphocaeibacter sp. TaxID=3100973 RepID=UPI0017F4C210|nr:DUF871 domain-containing protein [Gallicola sp.]